MKLIYQACNSYFLYLLQGYHVVYQFLNVKAVTNHENSYQLSTVQNRMYSIRFVLGRIHFKGLVHTYLVYRILKRASYVRYNIKILFKPSMEMIIIRSRNKIKATMILARYPVLSIIIFIGIRFSNSEYLLVRVKDGNLNQPRRNLTAGYNNGYRRGR